MPQWLGTLLSDPIVDILTSIVTGVVAALVTAEISLKRFYREKWWEAKREAYSNILRQLSDLWYYYVQREALELKEIQLDSRQVEELSQRQRQAEEHLRTASAMGAYFVSDETATALEELMRKLNDARFRSTHAYEWIEKSYKALEECIARVRKYAKADLGIK